MAAFNKIILAFHGALFLIYTAEATNSICHICGSPHAAPAPAPSAETPENDSVPGFPESAAVFDVTMYGAVADGKTESSLAFLAAWDAACNYAGDSVLFIPEGTFFIGQISFAGPCYNNQSPKVEIRGTLKAPANLDAFPTPTWIMFRELQRFDFTGGPGTSPSLLDAQGAEAWTKASCRRQIKCHNFPTSLKFVSVSNGTISNITLINSKGFHLTFLNSDNINVHGVNIAAPWNSPNTDGIHIGYSTNINITSSTVGVGDDCISIGPGSINTSISNIRCGPGHGISVGSLGRYPKEGDVLGVSVRNCTINGTQNGVRIKTWPASPASKASRLKFEDIVMINVSNPIIIDQEYCPWNTCNSSKPSRVKLRDIHYENIRGTTNTKSAVILTCSSEVPCENIQLLNINLNYTVGENLRGAYLNVKGALHGLEINGSSFQAEFVQDIG